MDRPRRPLYSNVRRTHAQAFYFRASRTEQVCVTFQLQPPDSYKAGKGHFLYRLLTKYSYWMIMHLAAALLDLIWWWLATLKGLGALRRLGPTYKKFEIPRKAKMGQVRVVAPRTMEGLWGIIGL